MYSLNTIQEYLFSTAHNHIAVAISSEAEQKTMEETLFPLMKECFDFGFTFCDKIKCDRFNTYPYYLILYNYNPADEGYTFNEAMYSFYYNKSSTTYETYYDEDGDVESEVEYTTPYIFTCYKWLQCLLTSQLGLKADTILFN